LLEGPKIGWSPRTQESRASARMLRREGTQNPRKPVLVSKVVNPFTRALVPPFIGRRGDFYIPRLPSNLENISNVNMSMNVFYIPWFAGLISYIYKPATSSHFKPGLFETTSLTWLPRISEVSFTKIYHSSRLPNRGFPKFAGSWLLEFHQIPVILKQTTKLRTKAKFGNYFVKCQNVSNSRRIQQDVFYEHLLATNLEFPIFKHTHEHFHELGNSDCFECERFLPNAPTGIEKPLSWVGGWCDPLPIGGGHLDFFMYINSYSIRFEL
jgi:hypothetical protein